MMKCGQERRMSPDHDSTATLVQRARAGDETALETLLARHFAALRDRIARRIDPRWQSLLSADDVMQQTGIDAFLRIKSMRADDEDAFCGWLYRLASNNLIDAIRRLEADKRPPAYRRIDAPGSPSTRTLHESIFGVDSDTPSRVVAGRESEQLLQAAFERLPPAYREVVQLYDLQAMPIQEVAIALGRSPGAVHMLRARAHELLRQILTNGAEKLPSPA
jgi:RNA polymerase sigma-70 factor (ECF subfamily)